MRSLECGGTDTEDVSTIYNIVRFPVLTQLQKKVQIWVAFSKNIFSKKKNSKNVFYDSWKNGQKERKNNKN